LFENGELVEMGKHEELVKIEGGKYAHLFRLQSEGYKEFNQEEKTED
jgi:ABC-type multidrug transport system fused ATPase/permease subunit